jgi:DNA-binding transcriptional MerR regulator
MQLRSKLITIGGFARLSGLTVKALRHYDDVGLLEPAWVDPETGYRWYALTQARTAAAICRLRALEVPLEEIRAILADPGSTAERLLVHRSRLEGRAAETARLLSELQPIIDGKEELVPEPVRIKFELSIQDVSEVRALLVTERARTEEMSVVMPRAIGEVHGYLVELGQTFLGPPICVCPFPDDDGVAEVEIGWPVREGVASHGRAEVKTLPATRALTLKHTGPYEELSRSYRLMSEAMERHGLTAIDAPRELYLTNPEEVESPNDYETLIVWPIGPDGDLSVPEGDFFMRRVESD